MINASIQKYLNQVLSERLGAEIPDLQFSTIGGGCINETYQVKITSSTTFFLKINSVMRFPKLFEKENSGLEFLRNQKVIRVPDIVCLRELDNYQVLLLEWIHGGIKTQDFWKKFGEQLAALHRCTWSNKNGETLFGFQEDNYIGSLVQNNSPCNNWIEFFIQRRLQPQIRIALDGNRITSKTLRTFENLYQRLPQIFNNENSSLLHGDLWAGNFMCDESSQPALIDPAIYFGHRSMDLAMTTLFGGFDKQFYDSYNHHCPLPQNSREQWDICNLYPLLIHLNLFGAGYLGSIESTLRRFS